MPYSMFAEGFVSNNDADILENYLDKDISKITYKSIDCDVHNFFTSSPNHNLSDDNIEWSKYKDVFMPYISDFLLKLTDNVESVNLQIYLNLGKKGSYIAPHYDGCNTKTSFMLLYCPKNYENSDAYTSYLTCEKYYQTFSKFEKLPGSKDYYINLLHEKGKFYIVPTNLIHWVAKVNDDIDRVTIMTLIEPEFKL